MDLPNDLPSRYTRTTQENDAPIKATNIESIVDRPGFIKWDDTSDAGVSFSFKPARKKIEASQLDVNNLVSGGYVKMTSEVQASSGAAADHPHHKNRLRSGHKHSKKDSVDAAPTSSPTDAPKQMSGYYIRGYGDTPIASQNPIVTTVSAPAPAATPAQGEAHHINKLLFLLAGLVIGMVAGRFATKKGWL